MCVRRMYVRRRNARWMAMGFSPSTHSGLALTSDVYGRSDVFLVHFPDMPRSTTDVFIGNVGFPPLVPYDSARREGEEFIQLGVDDVRVDNLLAKKSSPFPERLIWC